MLRWALLLFVFLVIQPADRPVAAAEWFFVNSTTQILKEDQKHPRSWTIEVPISKTTGQSRIWFSYARGAGAIADRDRGRVSANLEISRADGSRLHYEAEGSVTSSRTTGTFVDSNGIAVTLRLEPGDIVVCDFSFSEMPRLPKGDVVVTEVHVRDGSLGPGLLQNSTETHVAEAKKSGWRYSARATQLVPSLAYTKHPKSVTTGLLIAGRARLVPCFTYESDPERGFRGKVIATVTLLRTDGTSKRRRLQGSRRALSLVQCGRKLSVRKNDRLLVDFKFKKFGRARLVTAVASLHLTDPT